MTVKVIFVVVKIIQQLNNLNKPYTYVKLKPFFESVHGNNILQACEINHVLSDREPTGELSMCLYDEEAAKEFVLGEKLSLTFKPIKTKRKKI